MSVTAPAGALGNVGVSVTGVEAALGLTHPASGGTLAVQDFTVAMSPSWPDYATVGLNSNVTYTINTSGLNGFGQQTGQVITLEYISTSLNGIPNCSLSNTVLYPAGGVGQTSFTSVSPGQTALLTMFSGDNPQYRCTFQVLALYNGARHVLSGLYVQQGTGEWSEPQN